jgi:N-glycosylase/DNA lyase
MPTKRDGHEFYLFPKREDLLDLSVDHFKDMGFGYRAKNIHSFLHNYPEFIFQNQYNGLELNKKLQEIDGIGQKVADCIQLFGFGDLTIFPVDTWIHKYMN